MSRTTESIIADNCILNHLSKSKELQLGGKEEFRNFPLITRPPCPVSLMLLFEEVEEEGMTDKLNEKWERLSGVTYITLGLN